ncbi:hypothetical protein OQA88_7211 [Cercophora sp. LCS_1]
MSVELVLAAVAAADLCLKYGKELTQAYQAFKDASEEIKDRILIVEAVWHRSSVQIQFARRIFRTAPEEHCRIHLDAFETLRAKLATAVNKLESVAAPFSKDSRTSIVIGRLKYAIIRNSLDAAISDLERWQRVFDPTWFLLLRIGDKLIDSELTIKIVSPPKAATHSSATAPPLSTARNLRGVLSGESPEVHVSLPENGLAWETALSVPFSSTRVIQRAGSIKSFVVDTILCDSNVNIASARTDAEGLAKKLKHTDPSVFGLLTCHGLVKRKDKTTGRLTSIDLIFRPPSGSSPTPGGKDSLPVSLRKRLMQPQNISLTQAVDIARQLASAVSFIHTCEFVHKNIRPETILFFPDSEKPEGLGSPYMLGFDAFRNVNFQTLRKGDTAWHRNLYRHPQRQGVRANDTYVMQHDVYSLGVCLLELGLWQSFVSYKQDGEDLGESEQTPSEALTQLFEEFNLNETGVEGRLAGASAKDELTRLAKTRLPLKLGDRYTEVVVTCLTCLDEENTDFFGQAEEDMQDQDGVLIGTRFIEKVLMRLNEIYI